MYRSCLWERERGRGGGEEQPTLSKQVAPWDISRKWPYSLRLGSGLPSRSMPLKFTPASCIHFTPFYWDEGPIEPCVLPAHADIGDSATRLL